MGRLSTLLRWHREDPVSEAERLRNARIFDDWQRNRNPFVDEPIFAELLFLADSPQTDNDGDGLSDFWEAQMLGHLDSDAQDDSDLDQVPLLLEQAFHMDPKVSDQAKLPEVLSGPSADTQIVRFRWSRSLAPYLRYTLERSPTMEPDTWTPITSEATTEDLNADVSEVSFLLDTESIDFMFYRVHVTALP